MALRTLLKVCQQKLKYKTEIHKAIKFAILLTRGERELNLTELSCILLRFMPKYILKIVTIDFLPLSVRAIRKLNLFGDLNKIMKKLKFLVEKGVKFLIKKCAVNLLGVPTRYMIY